MIQPTEYGHLREHGLTEREALASAAILPNLPETNVLVALAPDTRPHAVTWEDPDPIERLQRYEKPIVPGGDVYRAVVEGDDSRYMSIVPVPYSRRGYYVHEGDVRLFAPVDPTDTDFETDQTTLTDFGIPSPHFAKTHESMSSAYDRKPNLPV